MYLKHFGFAQYPCESNIPPDEMYVSASMAELSTRLKHLVDLRGIGLLTGDPGAGKSAACRKMVATLHTGVYKTLYVPLSTGNPMDLYKTIAWELGLPTERNRAALYKRIREEVTRLCVDAKIHTVLIIDEAHCLRNDVIEELRLLTNYAMDSENRLCLLFAGQTELRRRLGMAVHEALNQRIVVRYHLPGLTRDEVDEYLSHLTKRAGCELPLFEPAAVEAIFQATNGLPRKIGLLAHHALLAAALDKAKTVTEEHVQTALPEVK
ncbi:MAG: AAA family ATPase [Myxococcota bacterium]|nr:AAA family ATPase [Myxococcota bacterium]